MLCVHGVYVCVCVCTFADCAASIISSMQASINICVVARIHHITIILKHASVDVSTSESTYI